ncbi:MAG: MarR family transcriptional regulator, partial [Cenarchaeum sp. SB0663_bin_5]|nr:MarR family transcriptional regulator [Cenarchaeum sp. SB0663_bin_5]
GVKTSAANKYLKDAVTKGTIKRVGGYSGHWLYQVVSS